MSRKKTAQSAWMREHQRDPFVKEAHSKAYRSRAFFKLAEIDRQYRLIHQGMQVVDLGAAPGGWSQYATKQLNGNGKIFALDLRPMQALSGVSFIQGDFNEPKTQERLFTCLQRKKVDLIMSDMAPNISGIKAVDQSRVIGLIEQVMMLATAVLKPQGNLVVKVFQGEGFEQLLQLFRDQFLQLLVYKPKSSLTRSREVYFVAKGLKKL